MYAHNPDFYNRTFGLMNKDRIEELIKQIEKGASPKSIAEYLGDIVDFKTFNDSVNQDRYIVKSNDGNIDVCVAINETKNVDWISLRGNNINLTYESFEKISEEVKVHYNTYDNSKSIQLIFYPILSCDLQAIMAWVDIEEYKKDKTSELKLNNLILHFGKNKIPVTSREWVYMHEK